VPASARATEKKRMIAAAAILAKGGSEVTVPETAVQGACSVLVVDDQATFRGALRQLLTTSPTFVFAGEAECGETAVSETMELAADLVPMDVAMPGIGGIEATRAIKAYRPQTVVVLVSVRRPDELTPEAALCGADEILWKGDLTRKRLEGIWERHRKLRD
jgi:DNA-binding NarL/FixJ family response regulator